MTLYIGNGLPSVHISTEKLHMANSPDNVKEILKNLNSVENTEITLDLLCNNSIRGSQKRSIYKKMLPNVISKLGCQDIINLNLAVEGNRGDDKNKEVLSKLKGMLIQRVFDNKNAQHLFDKFRKGKIIAKNLTRELNKIKTDASKISAMSENKDIMTRTIFDEIVKTINKLELSTASKSKLKSIESYVAKSELKCSTPRLEEERKKQRLISYQPGKDQGIKQQIFRDIDAMHPILKNEQNAKEIIFNLLASSFYTHNGISSYNAQLEEAVAGVLCMYELNGILDSDAEKTTIIKPKDGYCDFHVKFLKDGRMVKFGIDPFRVSDHAGFDRTFLHHTNSEKRNGDDFPVIGVACLDSENENVQHEKIFELVDKYSDKELNLAIYSPQYGCKLIEFDTYKFDGSVTLTKAGWQNLR